MKAKFFISIVLILGMLIPQSGSVSFANHVSDTLSVTNSVSGWVSDGNSIGIAGVTIRAVLNYYHQFVPFINSNNASSPSGPMANPPDTDQNFFTVQTDAYGNYSFDALPPGLYTISAEKIGLDFAPLYYTVNSSSGGGKYDFQVNIIPTIYTPDTRNLSQTTISQLISISSDGSDYTFAVETPELSQINIGDIIIGGISTITPDGFLRKVLSKSNNAGQIILETEPATLVNAFESISVNTTQQLTTADIKSITDIPGVKLLQTPNQTQLSDFEFLMNNAVLYDQDGNLSTTEDQIVANGLLSVNPKIDFRLRIENSTVKEFYFTSDMRVQIGFTVTSKISLAVSMEKNLLPTIHLGAIPIGPLILTPDLDLIAGISGSVYAGISSSITNTSSVTAGLWYLNGQTQNLSKFESKFSFNPFSFQYGVSFKAFVGPKITAKIYGVVGAYIKSGYVLNLNIAPTADPWLTLKGGLEVSVGVSVTIPIIDIVILNIQLGAINQWWLLYSLSQSSNSQPFPPSNPSPIPNAINQSLTPQLSWSGGDPDGDALVYDIYFGIKDSFPATKIADHQSGTNFNLDSLTSGTVYTWQVIAFDQHGLSTPGPVWRFTTSGNDIASEMVLIPAGTFQMGCDPNHNAGLSCESPELPLHTIFLDAYQIDKYEVTNAQYAQCVTAGICSVPDYFKSATRSSYYDNFTYASYPVIFVSWNDANNYCSWAGKRLPTEAEWEKAARGSNDTRAYPWGDDLPICLYGNFPGCGGDTKSIGTSPAGDSPWGVSDMTGNVQEWVNDWYALDYYYYSPDVNPLGPESSDTGKVVRGGAYSAYQPTRTLRLAYRYNNGAVVNYSAANTGFRCAVIPGGDFGNLAPTSQLTYHLYQVR